MSEELIREFESMTDEQLAQLSDDELSEIQAIAESMSSSKEQSSRPDVPQFAPGQTHMIDPVTKRAVPIPEDQVISDISGADAAMRGMQQGIPFAKDVEAGAKALLDGSTSFDEAYSRNMDEINEAMREAEDKHPVAFHMGDFAASAAIPAAKGYKAAMTLGALSGISRAEDRDVWDAASGAAAGAVGLKIGRKAAEGIAFVGEKLGIIAQNTTKEILVRGGSTENVNAHIRKWFVNEGEDLAQGTARFADDVLSKRIGGKPLITGKDVPETIYNKAKDLANFAGKKVDDAIESVNYDLKSNEVTNIFGWLRQATGIDDMISSKSTVAVEQGQSLLTRLTREFYEETGEFIEKKSSKMINGVMETVVESVPKMRPKKLSLKDLVKMRRVYAGLSSVKHLNGQAIPGSDNVEFWGNVTKSISGMTADLAENTGKIDKVAFKALNRDYATAKLIEESTKKLADSQKSGMMGKLRDLLQYKSMTLTASMLTGVAFGGAPGAIIGATAGVLTGLAADPRAPQKFSIGLTKLANNLQNPNYAKYVQQLGVASTISMDSLREKLSSISSQLVLETSPVKRTTDSVMENAPEILNILTDQAPELAPVFRKALEAGDREQIGMMMEQLEDQGDAKAFLSGGEGWDGKVYSPERKAKFLNQINNFDISERQKNEHRKNLRENNLIPQVQQEPERFLQFKTRDKKRPAF